MHAQTHSLLTRQQQLLASGDCDDDGRPLARQVFFEPDDWLVPQMYAGLLAAHAAWLAERPDQVVLVSGHSYGTGSHRFFWLMGDRRAIAVRSALLKAGAAPNQVLIQSRGAARPQIELAGAEVAQYRRRVTLDYLDAQALSTAPLPPDGSADWWRSVFGSGGKAPLPADLPAAQGG